MLVDLRHSGELLTVPLALSPLDRQIIELLQQDGRRSYARLARELGVEQRAISARLRELRDSRVVQIAINGNPRALGYRSVALVGVSTSGRDPWDAAAALAGLDECPYVAVTTGRFQILAECFAADSAHLASVLSTVQATLGPGHLYETLPYTEVTYKQIHFQAAYRRPGAGDEPAVGSGPAVSAIDAEILARLAVDGRTPFKTIADELSVSEAYIRLRYRRLLGSGAVRVQAFVHPKTLGFDSTAWLGISLHHGGARRGDVAGRLSQAPGITYIATCLGRFDLVAEVVAIDIADLERIVDEATAGLAEVRDVEPFMCLGLHYKPLNPVVG